MKRVPDVIKIAPVVRYGRVGEYPLRMAGRSPTRIVELPEWRKRGRSRVWLMRGERQSRGSTEGWRP